MEKQNIGYIKNTLKNYSLDLNSGEKSSSEFDEFKKLYQSISNSDEKNDYFDSELDINQEQGNNDDNTSNLVHYKNSTEEEINFKNQNIFTNPHNNINLPISSLKNKENTRSVIRDLLDFDFNDNENTDDENSDILYTILMEELSESIGKNYKNMKEEVSYLIELLRKNKPRSRKLKELHSDIGMMVLAMDYLSRLFTKIEERKPKEDNALNKKIEKVSSSDKEIYITVLGDMENTNKLANFLVLTKRISKWEIYKVNYDSVSIYIWAKDDIYFYDIIEIADSLEIDILPF
ncbi:hypothetical protein [Tepidibacter hydrothermalis]|uniref:Uncharacterized protein n=1 Tax=Tepidibacter hydrothermalis TaxID=3036126 RepID=A0ABY8ECD1_9FIRM|nr:hypothetical protein [Tepidibacter hydrothermalis]WFD10578.1 hypothetical protein P4S50_00460 [Tepidibacter hydrothermalis]